LFAIDTTPQEGGSSRVMLLPRANFILDAKFNFNFAHATVSIESRFLFSIIAPLVARRIAWTFKFPISLS